MAPQIEFSACTDSEDQVSPLNELSEATEPSTKISTPSSVPTKVGISFGKPPIYITPRTTTHHGPTPSAEERGYTSTRPLRKPDEHFSTPAPLILEFRRIPNPHTSVPVSPGGIVPRREWQDFASVHHGPSTLLTRPSTASATAPATTPTVLSDGMPDLPPLPTPIVEILMALTVLGLAATILVYLLTFPPPREGYFRRRRMAPAYESQERNIHDRDDYHTSSDDDEGSKYYSRVSSPTATSTAHFSPHTPRSPFLGRRAPPPPTEAEWLARRRAFDTDEEAFTSRTLRNPSSGLLSPLLATSTLHPPWSPGPGSSRPTIGRSKSSSGTVSPVADIQSGIRNRKMRPEIKSWLSSIDGVVDRAIGSAARYLSDDGEGDVEFRLPVAQ